MRVLIQRGGYPLGGWEAGKRVSLDDNEVHHLRVRRARDRESVEILDGAGLRGTGCLIQTGRQWVVEVRSVEHLEAPPETTLVVAAGDRDRFFWMVEKLVELGVTRLVPLETARSAAVATRLKDVHLRRLRRSALEATKQCGSAWALSVEEPVSVAELARTAPSGVCWLADQRGAPPPPALDSGPLTAVIGPEGGLTEGERAALLTAGFQPVILGTYTLRFETAALAVAAAATQARLRGQHA